MDKINLVLLLLTSFMMFARSDELISSTEVPTTAINNQNVTNYISDPSTVTKAEEETSTISATPLVVDVSSSSVENQLKLSNIITSTPEAMHQQATTEAQTEEVTAAEITLSSSSSHVDLITTTTMHSNGNEENEDSVVSFGIRSFTVEVSKGDEEKVSTTTGYSQTSYPTATAQTATIMPTVVVSENSNVDESVSEKSLETTSHPTPSSPPSHSSSSISKSDLNILFNDNDGGNVNDNNNNDDETSILLSSQENEIANEIQIDKKLDNGLYRIKIGEITTDEFSNGLNFDEPREDKLHQGKSKVNINDFFPSKIEDFRPIIEISNEKMLKEKDALHDEQVVLRGEEDEIILNEEPTTPVEVEAKSGTRINTSNVASTNIEIELIDDTPTVTSSSPSSSSSSSLPSHDEIITRVEEIVSEVPTLSKKINVDDIFIPRRSKKFDPKSNTQGPTRIHDFGMTKFNQKNINVTQNHAVNGKPEYSTTKFYNSKELYNEILHKESKGASTSTPKTTIKPNIVRDKLLSSNKIPIEASRLMASTFTAESLTTVTASTIQQQHQQRPFTAHPRVISRLEEKLNQLDCDIQNLSADSTVWRGNETHELNLPTTVSLFFFRN